MNGLLLGGPVLIEPTPIPIIVPVLKMLDLPVEDIFVLVIHLLEQKELIKRFEMDLLIYLSVEEFTEVRDQLLLLLESFLFPSHGSLVAALEAAIPPRPTGSG